MLCPKCGQEMQRRSQSGFTLDRCPACRGLWFDQHELSKHLSAMRVRSPEPRLTGTAPTGLRCPRCEASALETAQVRDVAVERCPDCRGLFLDGGDLEALVRPDREE